jgi:hypothetical protein
MKRIELNIAGCPASATYSRNHRYLIRVYTGAFDSPEKTTYSNPDTTARAPDMR